MDNTNTVPAVGPICEEFSIEFSFASVRADTNSDIFDCCGSAKSKSSSLFILCSPDQQTQMGAFCAQLASHIITKHSIVNTSAKCSEKSFTRSFDRLDLEFQRLSLEQKRVGVSTLVAAVQGNQLTWAHKGRCCLYLITQGAMLNLNNLSSYKNNEDRNLNISNKFCGFTNEPLLGSLGQPLWAGDRLILCSPSLAIDFTIAEIAAIVSRKTSEEASQELVSRGIEKGARSCTCGVIIIKETEPNLNKEQNEEIEISLSKDEKCLNELAKTLGISLVSRKQKTKRLIKKIFSVKTFFLVLCLFSMFFFGVLLNRSNNNIIAQAQNYIFNIKPIGENNGQRIELK